LIGNSNLIVISIAFFSLALSIVIFIFLFHKESSKRSNWYFFIVLPLGVVLIYALSNLNIKGSFESVGFMSLFRNCLIFFSFPIFIFTIYRLKVSKFVIGMILIIVSSISLYYGITYSKIPEGYPVGIEDKITFWVIVIMFGIRGFIDILLSIKNMLYNSEQKN
jgi:hypothetical protein